MESYKTLYYLAFSLLGSLLQVVISLVVSECWVLNHGVFHRFLVGDDQSSFHLEFVHVSCQHVVVLNG